MAGIHFTYNSDPCDGDLCQGDVLERTPGFEALLKEFYPQYAARPENKYFLILTQTCDLVRRSGGRCVAPYISVAPVRPLSVALSRKLAEVAEADIGGRIPICTSKNKAKLDLWMERLLNNNEPNYFYLRKVPERRLAEDCCAHLALSIAIKSDLRYDLCLSSRILSLQPVFQAKLGWLVGQMYSRVGTEDWDRAEMYAEIKSTLKLRAIWVPDDKLMNLRTSVQDWRNEHPDAELDGKTVERLLARIPRQRDLVLERVVQLLKQRDLVPEGKEIQTRNLIANDPEFRALFKD